jgi:hypothetical protein
MTHAAGHNNTGGEGRTFTIRGTGELFGPSTTGTFGKTSMPLTIPAPTMQLLGFVPMMFHYTSLVQTDWHDVFGLVAEGGVFRIGDLIANNVFLNQANVTRLIAGDFMPGNSLPQTTFFGHVALLNTNALPRAFLAPAFRTAPDRDSCWALLRAAPASNALPIAVRADQTPGALFIAADYPGCVTSDYCHITRYSPNAVDIETRSTGPRLLVLADAWYPGWRACVNDKPVPITRVNWFMRGVELPAGIHHTVFRFCPHGVRLGACLAGLAVLVCLALYTVRQHIASAARATAAHYRWATFGLAVLVALIYAALMLGRNLDNIVWRLFVQPEVVQDKVYEPPCRLGAWRGSGEPPTVLVYPVMPEQNACYRFETVLSGEPGTKGNLVSDIITAGIWNPPEAATWLAATDVPRVPATLVREFVATGTLPAVTQLRAANLSDARVQVHRMRLLRVGTLAPPSLTTTTSHGWLAVINALYAALAVALIVYISWPAHAVSPDQSKQSL